MAPRSLTRPKGDDPRPTDGANHGTACAGVACANGRARRQRRRSRGAADAGAAGVRPRLAGRGRCVRVGRRPRRRRDLLQLGTGRRRRGGTRRIPPTSTSTRSPTPRGWRSNTPSRQGRGGRGCVITWAAGNGNESVDNDGYASYERVIAVAACNDLGTRSAYSDMGNALWCAFPSEPRRGLADAGHLDDRPQRHRRLQPRRRVARGRGGRLHELLRRDLERLPGRGRRRRAGPGGQPGARLAARCAICCGRAATGSTRPAASTTPTATARSTATAA